MPARCSLCQQPTYLISFDSETNLRHSENDTQLSKDTQQMKEAEFNSVLFFFFLWQHWSLNSGLMLGGQVFFTT
jgi:hypothetical protein